MYEKIRKLHFVGIGGIGMSGIAEVLLNLGYQVSGSDMSSNASVQRLRDLGATLFIGHNSENVRHADVVVRSSAIKPDNPEILEARRLRIPMARRAEMLAELMRIKYGIAIAGTHGKTTTTSMTAALLHEAGMDPTVVNGGVVKAFGSNARLGHGDFLVTEADESDGSFLKLFPTIAVVTNMDPEHMEFYKNFDAVRLAYQGFLEKIPFYGLAVLCYDHPEVAALIPRLEDKRVITYGLNPGADYQARNIRQEQGRTHFQVFFQDREREESLLLGDVGIPLPGRHNISNALAAMAVALELSIPWEIIVQGLDRYHGVRRRFDILSDTPERTIIDDYAHHPTEIRATLSAARDAYGPRRLVAIFQPHRYSRVHDLFEEFLGCFAEADLVLVDRIYPAGEAPLPGILQDGGQIPLATGILAKSGTAAQSLPGGENWREALERLLQPGDVVLFLGAGSITHRARDFAVS
ncbi:MAG: UDP-N-acetylmuramate--L-alanine ligase [Magnetococcales bacterium]|nr:UDP-N-acetylmuramate--L-alanine ligase [Magnetococcales bacterium]MBF0439212.1 UDP-N-acetylmuramate--L-alanine ligase [Magnetococcales bacterium]